MGKTVADLKDELRKRKLPTDGLKADLEKRLDAANQGVAEEAMNNVERQGRCRAEAETKRCKTVMNSVADEFMCPITQELPVDPVTAEDGKIYERSAIETWLGNNERSPSTGASMGTRLFPAVQVRSMIEQLVKSGAVDAEKAAAWTKKLEDETFVKELKSKAESGDAEAMLDLGVSYRSGKHGIAKDDKQARAWAERAADLGYVKAIATLGFYLCKGIGGGRYSTLGLYYMTKAAMLGSDVAAMNMAINFQNGFFGLPRNVEQARFWFTQLAEGKCTVVQSKSLTKKRVEEAKKQLQTLN